MPAHSGVTSTVVAPAATALAATPHSLSHANAPAALWKAPHAVLIPTSVERSAASAIWE
uniref:ALG2-interacting protein X n=1 Tax=Arundo donax TaxID=35708 RepID=A0A0A9D4R0_ARUDO